jgi:hypothetical protein
MISPCCLYIPELTEVGLSGCGCGTFSLALKGDEAHGPQKNRTLKPEQDEASSLCQSQ